MKVKVYTDGSCKGNPGPGGWGVVLLFEEREIQFAGTEKRTTNQQMELCAAIRGLTSVELRSEFQINKCEIILYTDSAYLYNCWKDNWWKKWQYNGWVNSKKEPVANKEYWELLIPWFQKSNFSIVKVKGHSENKYNAIADLLATGALKPNTKA